ncbi:MAG TPA: MMPL family transporter, partial [Acidimicrobiales bacterium]|nr:MMPL family transporter [Acidimicrobiales bacterium]
MFARTAQFVIRQPRRILAVSGVLLVLAGALGIHANSVLKPGGFTSPTSPSQVAQNRLNAYFGGQPNLVLLVTARSGQVDDPAVAAAGRAVTARLAGSAGVDRVSSYWTTKNPALRSTDLTQGLVVGTVAGNDKTITDRTKTLLKELSTGQSGTGPVTVRAGGFAGTNNAVSTQIGKDLKLAEGIAIPITFVLLVLAFGSVVAAALPVALGLLAILSALAILFLLGSVTDVSIYALN